eukprot:TRINITY_DN1159_c4_g1_i1.p1 TRINITY_DN1159_c4_g1~~TRINITY_DN1159_c4_g1_i1.p1  ORF type:complete len:469 (+),score=93.77 TRINITY_DN1159_c4_g1_i1:74-1480(+)
MKRLSRLALCRRAASTVADPKQAAVDAVTRDIERKVEVLMKDTIAPLDYWGMYGDLLKNKPKQPMVLLIGNHSAGKSTFINNLMGREIQNTGTAPTDDGFTVIRRGDSDSDADGPTLVGTPSYGFKDLEKMGPKLVNRLRYKVRKVEDSVCPENLLIIDSPGMIGSASGREARGYDFQKTMRWFAERADLILLVFDPENPGTTGETLDVLQGLTHSNLEHKYDIILNKADTFDSVNEFARAYGALCWNLSKILKTKDIPWVYTMYTPGVSDVKRDFLPFAEFDKSREEILNRVLNSPKMYPDTILTVLQLITRNLEVQTKVVSEMRRSYGKVRRNLYAALIGTCAYANIGCALAGAGIALQAPVAIASCVALAGGDYAIKRWLETVQKALLADIDKTMDACFPGCGEDIRMAYEHVKPIIISNLEHRKLTSVPLPSNRQLNNLRHAIKTDIPELREYASKVKVSASKA